MKKTYRVLHLIKSLGRGGAETLLAEGYRFADRERFTYCYGYFLPWKDAVVPSLKQNGAEVVCFDSDGFGGMLLSLGRISGYLKTWNADLIHCHLPLAGVVGRLAGRWTTIPVVYTEHNLWERYNPWTRRVNRATWNLQDAVIAVSQEVRTSIEAHIKHSVPLMVVQNGIPVDSYRPSDQSRLEIRAQFKIPPDALVIGTVAVFRVQKGLQTWLKAAKQLQEHSPNIHFLLVGDGPLREELKQLTGQLNLNDFVHFAGLQDPVAPFYSAMDIYLNSSTFEGLPLTLLEAMASELPVVATTVGGIPEVIRDNKTGFLIAPNSTEQIVEKVKILLDNKQMRKEFGQEGRLLVERDFSIQRMVKQLEEIYLNILEKRSRSN